MDTSIDYFDSLPDEVIQLIFSFVSDCKSLVRCMSVSKAFRQQSVRVSSLSIVCPGSFSSYDDKLQRIYSMVKGFRKLQSLVVRVGQPKEEPPSWARCMRYAEIGCSVEKFMFMAAKSGNFSELDFTLLGLDRVADGEELQTRGRNMVGVSEASIGGPTVVDDCERTARPSLMDPEWEGHDSRSPEAWSDAESDEESWQRGFLGRGDESSERQNAEDIENDGRPSEISNYSKFQLSDACFLRGPEQRRELSDFCLRQVIAPSNDVLRRMLPVIHFAIVQGLNELRDSLPAFVSQFSELRTFLLVDMVESITVFMREHHIQEIRALYLQELSEWNSPVLPNLEPSPSGARQDEKQEQAKLFTDRDTEFGRETDVNAIDARNVEERLCEMPHQGVLGVARDCPTEEQEGSRCCDDENGSIRAASKCEHDGLESALKGRERKGKEMMNRVAGVDSLGKQQLELHHRGCKSRLPCFLQEHTGTSKGKGKLERYNNEETSWSNIAAVHGFSSFQGSDLLLKDFSRNSLDRHDRALPCDEFARLKEEHLTMPICELPSSEESEDGASDAGEYHRSSSNATHTGGAAQSVLDRCDRSLEMGACENLVESRWDETCRYPHLQADEGEELNAESKNDRILQLKHMEVWDGRSEGFDGEFSRDREDAHRWKSCRLSRDMASRHPFKRSLKFDNLRMRDSNRCLRLACLKRRDDNLMSFDSGWKRGEAHIHRCSRIIDGAEKNCLNTATEGNEKFMKDEVAEEKYCSMHRSRDEDCKFCRLRGDASSSSHTASSDTSSSDRDSWENNSLLVHSIAKESAATLVDGSIPNGLAEGIPGKTAHGQTSNDGCDDHAKLVTESIEDGRPMSSERPRQEYGSMQSVSSELLVERPVETDVCRYTWRERVRRLRDYLSEAPGQEEHDQGYGDRRERSREVFRKRQRDLEKDALSFDYTFWRAEQVAACSYALGDVSMCIATHAARPLNDADKEILKHAALAGPLLVATVSHVNNHHTCHNL